VNFSTKLIECFTESIYILHFGSLILESFVGTRLNRYTAQKSFNIRRIGQLEQKLMHKHIVSTGRWWKQQTHHIMELQNFCCRIKKPSNLKCDSNFSIKKLQQIRWKPTDHEFVWEIYWNKTSPNLSTTKIM
jgi:hypothetical protein